MTDAFIAIALIMLALVIAPVAVGYYFGLWWGIGVAVLSIIGTYGAIVRSMEAD